MGILSIVVFVSALFISNAYAGAFANGAAPAGATFATELFGTGSDASVVPTATATAVYTMAAAPGAGAAYMVTFTLGNGATWGAALGSGSLAYATVGTGAVTIALVSGGGTDDATAQFRVDVTAAQAVGDTHTLTYDVNNADPLGTAAAKITLGITLTDGLGNVDTAGSVDAFTSAQGTTGALAATNTSTDIFIDVATGNTEFVGSGADWVSATEVIIGTVNISDGATAVEDDGQTAWSPGAGDATITAATLVLNGAFSACITAPGKLILDKAALNKDADTVTATTATWNLTQADIVAIKGGAVNVNMVVDGSTAIDETTPAATGTIDWTTATYQDLTYNGTFRALKRNGTVAYAGMVAGSGNAGWGGGFRIVNRTTSACNVYFQAQAVNGGAWSSQALYGTQVPANESLYISADALFETCGLPNTTTGNAIITVEADQVDIFQTSTTPNGHTIIPLTKANNQTY